MKGELILVQDIAPPHSASEIRGYFTDKPFQTPEWPSQSPDLNPIEYIWTIMKDKLFDRVEEIGSLDDIKDIIEEIFFEHETIELAIRNCYLSMHDRVQQVIERKGGHSGY
jgi:transposase